MFLADILCLEKKNCQVVRKQRGFQDKIKILVFVCITKSFYHLNAKLLGINKG